MTKEQLISKAYFVIVIIFFIPALTLFGAIFYGLFIYAKYLGASNFGAIVAIFMLVSSCGTTADRIKKRKKALVESDN